MQKGSGTEAARDCLLQCEKCVKKILFWCLLFQCLANVEAYIDFSEDENIEEDAVDNGK